MVVFLPAQALTVRAAAQADGAWTWSDLSEDRVRSHQVQGAQEEASHLPEGRRRVASHSLECRR